MAHFSNECAPHNRTPRPANLNGRIPLANPSPRLFGLVERARHGNVWIYSFKLAHSTAKMLFRRSFFKASCHPFSS
jgi:hypothetical protein